MTHSHDILDDVEGPSGKQIVHQRAGDKSEHIQRDMPPGRLVRLVVEADQAGYDVGHEGETGSDVDDPGENRDPALHEPPEFGPLLGEPS